MTATTDKPFIGTCQCRSCRHKWLGHFPVALAAGKCPECPMCGGRSDVIKVICNLREELPNERITEECN